jgi:hypothetical protein
LLGVAATAAGSCSGACLLTSLLRMVVYTTALLGGKAQTLTQLQELALLVEKYKY